MARSIRTVCYFILLFIPGSIFTQVILTEVMFDPVGSEYTDEFVEIYNSSKSDSVSLIGWRLTDGSGDDDVIGTGKGLFILPGQYAIILDRDYFGNSTAYDLLIPEEALILTVDGSTLGSSGLSNSRTEAVSLLDAAGYVVSQYFYSIGNCPGHSDEKINLQGNDDDENWADSRVINGSPGFVNSVARFQYDLRVSTLWTEPMTLRIGMEVDLWTSIFNTGLRSVSDFIVHFFEDFDHDSVFDSEEKIGSFVYGTFDLAAHETLNVSIGWDIRGAGTRFIGAGIEFPPDERPEDNLRIMEMTVGFAERALVLNEIMCRPLWDQPEWVELHNPEDTDIDLRGWKISDEDTSDMVIITQENVIIPPSGYCVLAEASDFVIGPFSQSDLLIVHEFPSLNNEGDGVVLMDPAGFVIDRVDYRKDWGTGSGLSLERINPHGYSNDSSNWGTCVSIEGSTPGKQNSLFTTILPSRAALSISPNPFSPDEDGMEDVTVISYCLPMKTSRINLRIFDVHGRRIRNLRGASRSGSQGSVQWDGRDDEGRLARIGIYVVYLEGLNDLEGIVVTAKSTVVLAARL